MTLICTVVDIILNATELHKHEFGRGNVTSLWLDVGNVTPPISSGTTDKLRPLPYKSKCETYYSVTYLYFSSINNICVILAMVGKLLLIYCVQYKL